MNDFTASMLRLVVIMFVIISNGQESKLFDHEREKYLDVQGFLRFNSGHCIKTWQHLWPQVLLEIIEMNNKL